MKTIPRNAEHVIRCVDCKRYFGYDKLSQTPDCCPNCGYETRVKWQNWYAKFI